MAQHYSHPALRAYLETALWSSTDDDGRPLDDTYGPEDVPETALHASAADLDGFYALLSDDCRAAYPLADLAHDFWLTRNGHGAGFWDGDYPQPFAEELTKWAKSFGSVDIVVGDDGGLWFS